MKVLRSKALGAVALLIVILIQLFGPAFIIPVGAADTEPKNSFTLFNLTPNVPYVGAITTTIDFSFNIASTPQNKDIIDTLSEDGGVDFKIVEVSGDNWSKTKSTSLWINPKSESDDSGSYITFTGYVGDVSHTKASTVGSPSRITVKATSEILGNVPLTFSGTIESKYFEKPKSETSSTPDKDEPAPESRITIENVILFDENNKEISEVTKKTEPFTVSILYQDSGLEQEDMYNLLDDSLQVFWNTEETEGFDRPVNTKGKLTTRHQSTDGFPRFRADFDQVTFNEKANTLHFKVRYRLGDGQTLEEKVSVKIPQAKMPEEKKEEEKEEKKIAPLTPHIIVAQYSYGEEQIQAGTEFTLDMTFRNTSSDIPLENIVMTVTPPEDVSIASSSNTEYIPGLGAGGTQSHSINLKAKPSAKVGSAEIEITFTYEFVDYVNKERKEGEFKEKIAIPISQIDRFEVDPITDIPSEAYVDDPIYMVVKFVNRGKSTTYNISAIADGNLDITTGSEHVGNLEAGKSGDVEISITPHETGLLRGNVLIQYEDENTNQKELKMPYEVFIDEPWQPDPMDDPGMDMEIPEGPPKMTSMAITLIAVGSALVAIPLVLYFAKRARKKESEELYEDF